MRLDIKALSVKRIRFSNAIEQVFIDGRSSVVGSVSIKRC